MTNSEEQEDFLEWMARLIDSWAKWYDWDLDDSESDEEAENVPSLNKKQKKTSQEEIF